jgi:hypothetical protein
MLEEARYTYNENPALFSFRIKLEPYSNILEESLGNRRPLDVY